MTTFCFISFDLGRKTLKGGEGDLNINFLFTSNCRFSKFLNTGGDGLDILTLLFSVK